MDKRIEYLREFVSGERRALFERLIEERTGYATVLLEDMYQSRNCSAILRTCDCLGVQHVHVVEGKYPFREDPGVSMGAGAWLSVHRYSREEGGVVRAAEVLRGEGFRIVAATPGERESMVDDLDARRGKVAFLVGTEATGLSAEALALADERVKVPVYGFMESYNAGVCAALLLYSVVQRARRDGVAWRLGERERQEVLLAWYKRAVRDSDAILRRFEEGMAGDDLSPGRRLDDLEKVGRFEGGPSDESAVDVGTGE
ncbi:MAG: RNA methyltransferase [Odoribacteraceae bacterium]|nr:RNA methyltransferase [Odoribacteraceae bacterium]